LERSNGLSADRIRSVRQELASAEAASGSNRASALSRLATQLAGEAGRSQDATKVGALVEATRDLAAAN
jgi:hypothetical protein